MIGRGEVALDEADQLLQALIDDAVVAVLLKHAAEQVDDALPVDGVVPGIILPKLVTHMKVRVARGQ